MPLTSGRRRGGGTDLRQGFARALATRPRPDVVVALTDGQTPWPAPQPPCRAVVGLFQRTGPPHRWTATPEWARVVRIG